MLGFGCGSAPAQSQGFKPPHLKTKTLTHSPTFPRPSARAPIPIIIEVLCSVLPVSFIQRIL